jgi:Peptidase family M48
LWGYNVGRDMSQEAFTKILVDSADTVKDQSESGQELSPVAAERAWERQAEENILERMQRAALLAPPGDVEKVLQTVVDNLMITNNLTLEPEVRCRILLTEPIESFTVGHTIVVSRGLLDVLPDEATLAAVLAHELSHIVLAHRLDTKYAFGDRIIFPDDQTLQNMAMMRSPEEEQAADKKSLELLRNSPYKDKLATVGLFMKQLDMSRNALPKLIRGQVGNSLMVDAKPRLATVMANAPNLEPDKIDQIAALPLGGRIKVDPWSGGVEISKAKPVAILNAREKMPFEVTPVFPYLMRIQPTRAVAPVAAYTNTGAQ